MTCATPTTCSAISLPDGSGDAAPEWLHLLPVGAVRTADGRGPYRTSDTSQLIAGSLAAGQKLPLDECHATDLAAPAGRPAPARGWIVELQSRADGIWGRVEWTGEGRRIVADRQYRGVSPVVVHDKSNVITRILRASLTNTPNLEGLVALHSEERRMDFRAWLIEAFGLAADAADDAIVAAMTKGLALPADADQAAIAAALKAKLTATDAGVALHSALAPIAAAAGLSAGADAAAIVAGVSALKADAPTNAAVIALQAELATAVGTVNDLVEANARREATGFVDGAIATGRAGVKPMRDEYIALHMADPARAQKLIGAMPIVRAGATLGGVPADVAQDGLGAADAQVLQLMGLDRAAYAATLGDNRVEVL